MANPLNTTIPNGWLSVLNKHWPDQLGEIIEASNTHPHQCVYGWREPKVSRETYKATLNGKGIKINRGWVFKRRMYLEKMRTRYKEFTLISKTVLLAFKMKPAQLSAYIFVTTKPEIKYCDACAAPGGKTGHLLEKGDNVELTAVELEPWSNGKKSNPTWALSYSAKTWICADAGEIRHLVVTGRTFDKILLDVAVLLHGVIVVTQTLRSIANPQTLMNG